MHSELVVELRTNQVQNLGGRTRRLFRVEENQNVSPTFDFNTQTRLARGKGLATLLFGKG